MRFRYWLVILLITIILIIVLGFIFIWLKLFRQKESHATTPIVIESPPPSSTSAAKLDDLIKSVAKVALSAAKNLTPREADDTDEKFTPSAPPYEPISPSSSTKDITDAETTGLYPVLPPKYSPPETHPTMFPPVLYKLPDLRRMHTYAK